MIWLDHTQAEMDNEEVYDATLLPGALGEGTIILKRRN